LYGQIQWWRGLFFCNIIHLIKKSGWDKPKYIIDKDEQSLILVAKLTRSITLQTLYAPGSNLSLWGLKIALLPAGVECPPLHFTPFLKVASSHHFIKRKYNE